ncbi:thiomuracin/GE37468 family thiazolyl RiPP peptide [Streptomyces sp. NPDC055992]|uniref:thiomuracin/GE37468 family thiazolyl RiPP peptide n=1 Tax=Streptomyces sp. NPDC055992 TaxID=3345673 RepID=UPI0035E2911C
MEDLGDLEFNLDDIPADVFELADSGLTVESLTSGHGLAENGASAPSCGSSCSPFPEPAGGCRDLAVPAPTASSIHVRD